MHRKSELNIWVNGSKNTLLKRGFQLSKDEKQADIQPVYTHIQGRYTLDIRKKCELQVNLQGRRY